MSVNKKVTVPLGGWITVSFSQKELNHQMDFLTRLLDYTSLASFTSLFPPVFIIHKLYPFCDSERHTE